MGVYEDNLNALKLANEDIYTYVVNEEYDASCISVEYSKDNDKILRYENIYLNSRYSVVREAERYMEDAVNLPDEAILVMFGLSNGSFIKEFYNKNKKTNHYIIVEPSRDILFTVLHNINISDILSDDRCRIICCGINDDIFSSYVSSYLRNYNINTNKYIAAPRYGELFPKQLEWMTKCLNELLDRQKIENNTIKRVGALSCKNMLLNMRYFEGCRSADDMTGRFPENMPAVVVSAGPSLAKNVHILEKAKGKAFILCTDSAINTVLETGILPDMITSVDFAKPVKIFKAEGLNNIPFLADMDLNSEVLEVVNPKDLFFSTQSDMIMGKLFERAGSLIKDVDIGGSVATSAIANLVKWGFKKIILIGQDLAFTGNKIHVGTQYDEDDKIDINNQDYEFVEGINGDMLPVSKDYFQYLRWIEELGRSNQDIEIIDATEGGSKKKFTTIMTFEEAINKYCTQEYDIKNILDSIPRLFVGEEKKYIEEYIDSMLEYMCYFKEKFNTAAQLCALGRDILMSGNYDIAKLKLINEYMDFLDNEYVNSDFIMMVAKYNAEAEEIFAMDMYIEEEDDIAESIRMYEKSKMYYNMIEEAIDGLTKLITVCKEEI